MVGALIPEFSGDPQARVHQSEKDHQPKWCHVRTSRLLGSIYFGDTYVDGLRALALYLCSYKTDLGGWTGIKFGGCSRDGRLRNAQEPLTILSNYSDLLDFLCMRLHDGG